VGTRDLLGAASDASPIGELQPRLAFNDTVRLEPFLVLYSLISRRSMCT
jgi:hypothetical protein